MLIICGVRVIVVMFDGCGWWLVLDDGCDVGCFDLVVDVVGVGLDLLLMWVWVLGYGVIWGMVLWFWIVLCCD